MPEVPRNLRHFSDIGGRATFEVYMGRRDKVAIIVSPKMLRVSVDFNNLSHIGEKNNF